MRVTNSMMSNTITRYLMRQSERLYKVQEQISTQKKINKPSDDPAGMREILDYRNKIATVDQYLENIKRATTRLEFTEITLDVVDDLIAALSALPDKIDVILALSCGRASAGNMDVALVVDFETWDHLELYRNHPAHIEPLERLREIASSIFVADLDVE